MPRPKFFKFFRRKDLTISQSETIRAVKLEDESERDAVKTLCGDLPVVNTMPVGSWFREGDIGKKEGTPMGPYCGVVLSNAVMEELYYEVPTSV